MDEKIVEISRAYADVDYETKWIGLTDACYEFGARSSSFHQFRFQKKELEGIAFMYLEGSNRILINSGLLGALEERRNKLWHMSIEYYYVFNVNNVNDRQLAKAIAMDLDMDVEVWYGWIRTHLEIKRDGSITSLDVRAKRLQFIEWCEDQIPPFIKRMRQRGELKYDGKEFYDE